MLKRNRISVYIIFFFVIVSCKPKTKNELFIELLNTITNNSIDIKTKAIVIISDNGCFKCNERFSNLIKKIYYNETIKIIISANENIIDISEYKSNPIKNIYFDTEKKLYNENFISTSTVLFFKNQQIDTIAEISANDLNSKLDYIQSKLQN